MKKYCSLLDAFVISGFVAGFFSGFLDPLYISLSCLRLRRPGDRHWLVHGLGVPRHHRCGLQQPDGVPTSLRRAALHHARGAGSGGRNRCPRSRRRWGVFIVSMFVLGVFSSSVVYLLQKMKEVRYRKNGQHSIGASTSQAVTARRRLGAQRRRLFGFRDPLAVAILGVAQTAIVTGCSSSSTGRYPTAARAARTRRRTHGAGRAKR